MKLIGLTGELCSGKTLAAKYWGGVGARVLNADLLVHALYRTDRSLKNALLEEFGKEVFAGGEIDRRKLGEIVFKNRRELKKLCRLVHPRVIKRIKSEVKKRKESVFVIDAPLLIEAGLHRAMDYVVVVKAGRARELRRCARRGLEKEKARKILKTQMPFRGKKRYADFVIDNNGSKNNLRNQVRKIWNKITEVKHG